VRRLATAALLALVMLPPPVAQAQNVGAIFRRVNPSVVIVRARWKEVGGTGLVSRVSEVGSGVLISVDGKVITAAHVVQTADEIMVEFLGGEGRSALRPTRPCRRGSPAWRRARRSP
jgi:serine protease Do